MKYLLDFFSFIFDIQPTRGGCCEHSFRWFIFIFNFSLPCYVLDVSEEQCYCLSQMIRRENTIIRLSNPCQCHHTYRPTSTRHHFCLHA